METRPATRRPQWGVVVTALFILSLGAAFLVWRASTPSECALVFPTPAEWSASGVRPETQNACASVAGQLVSAAEQRGDNAVEAVVSHSDGSSGQVTVPLDESPNLLARIGSAWSTILFVVSLTAVSGYAFVRRHADPAAGALLLLSCGLLGSTAVTVVGLPLRFAFSGWPRWLFLANVGGVYSLAWGGLLCFAVLFPRPSAWLDGRSRRRAALAATPPALWLMGIGLAGVINSGRPFGSLGWIHDTMVIQSVITVLSLLVVLTLLVVRMARSRAGADDSLARQQLLWIGLSGAAATLLVLALWMVPQLATGSPLLPADAIGVPGLLFVAGLAISLLKYRLFDLDGLLGRTVVYSALTLAVVVVYLSAVGILAAIFSTGATTPTAVAGAIVVAILINPLRVMLQRGVNRLMYGFRDDPYTALSRVAEQLTASARRRTTLPTVARDVGKALRVPYVSIEWQAGQHVSMTTVGKPPGNPADCYDVPLTFRGESVGLLRVANRVPGERFSPAERRLISDLSRQVGAAAHELQLSSELQHSRERLVLAREEERRAIRRILHDDIGPTIAGIALRAETVRQLARRRGSAGTDVPDVTTAVSAIGRDATAAASALRHLSYELRPPALDDRGLVLALRDQAIQFAPLSVSISTEGAADLESGLPAAVEVAAFRIAVAAMTNTARHAAARECRVRLVREDNWLTVEIDDDGSGLPADFSPGVGITSMRERARELGGDCTHQDRPEGGTSVRARIPIGAQE